MKFRAALLVNLGAILAWFWLIPLAVIQDVPVYDPAKGNYVNITELGPTVQWQAFGSIVRTVAIGAILGGGFLGLFKMTPTFIGIFGDIAQAFTGSRARNSSKAGVGTNGLSTTFPSSWHSPSSPSP